MWFPSYDRVYKLYKEGKQDKSVNFVQTVGLFFFSFLLNLLSLYVSLVNGREGEKTELKIAVEGVGTDHFSVYGLGLCNGYLYLLRVFRV